MYADNCHCKNNMSCRASLSLKTCPFQPPSRRWGLWPCLLLGCGMWDVGCGLKKGLLPGLSQTSLCTVCCRSNRSCLCNCMLQQPSIPQQPCRILVLLLTLIYSSNPDIEKHIGI